MKAAALIKHCVMICKVISEVEMGTRGFIHVFPIRDSGKISLCSSCSLFNELDSVKESREERSLNVRTHAELNVINKGKHARYNYRTIQTDGQTKGIDLAKSFSFFNFNKKSTIFWHFTPCSP